MHLVSALIKLGVIVHGLDGESALGELGLDVVAAALLDGTHLDWVAEFKHLGEAGGSLHLADFWLALLGEKQP